MTAQPYDLLAEAYAEHFPDMRAESQAELDLLAQFCARLPPGGQVLDAGCGAGRVAQYLRSLGLGVIGIDVSSEMVHVGRRLHPWLPVAVGSLCALPVASRSVDGVVMWYSTIHGGDQALAQALSEAHRVLKVGGRVILAFQEGRGQRDAGQAYRRIGIEVSLLRWLRTVTQVAAALEEAEFTVTDTLQRPRTASEADDQAFVVAVKTA